MTETSLALCQKPVLGLAMWLASLCATNQALHDAYLNLGLKNASLQQEFKAPMAERYWLRIYLENRPKDLATTEEQKDWSKIICQQPSNEEMVGETTTQEEQGVLSLALEIKTLQGQLVSTQKLTPVCPRPKGEDGHVLNLGTIDLKKGHYVISVINVNPISIPNSQKPLVLLSGTNAGFP